LNNFNTIKINLFKKENIVYFTLIFIIFILDRVTKIHVINELSDRDYFFNDYINFDLIWNTGIGFGILSTESELLYNIITIFIGLVLLVLFWILFTSDRFDKYIFSLIIGGAIGNFYDRLTLKAVPDFIDIHYNNFHWFTFNIADIFITLGIISFISRNLFVKN
jgi:signal peptidase II